MLDMELLVCSYSCLPHSPHSAPMFLSVPPLTPTLTGACQVPTRSEGSLRHLRNVVWSCGTKGLSPALAFVMSSPRVRRMAALT